MTPGAALPSLLLACAASHCSYESIPTRRITAVRNGGHPMSHMA